MDNEDAIRIAKQKIPILIEHSTHLIEISFDMSKNRSFKLNDGWAFMCLYFKAKQTDHLSSIKTLIENNFHKDAELIARSMLEGECLLVWTKRNKVFRSKLWREYAFIESFRAMNEDERREEPVDRELKSKVEEFLNNYGYRYGHYKPCKKINFKPLLEKSYRHTWHPASIFHTFKMIKADNLYELYDLISQRVHWGPGGLGGTITRKDKDFGYLREDHLAAARALIIGFHCLVNVCDSLNEHLKLGFSDILKENVGKFFTTVDSSINII